ncbi:kinase-like domain-containing protein [Mycena vulgaris]|nr:kinase-like domain-containing protein [Mycena vulgaris]KAJ6582939.1 kinase-like domain-containing protein [Mycena vulgaris]
MELNQLSGIRQTDLGKSKHVFKLRIDDAPAYWVAKCFFDVGHGTGKDLIENDVLLMRDLARLKRLSLLRDRFVEAARLTGAEVSEFTVSEAFVIVVESRAGKTVDATYLVEPLRTSTAVEKFSGTVGGSDNRANKLSSTMCAFTHFILQATACKQAFTDLQGSLHCSRPGAEQKLVLFDPMSHSLSGTTGVGDHGVEGIEDTIKTHKCSFMCVSMNLANMASIKATFTAEKEALDNMDLESEDGLQGLDGFVLNHAPSAEEVAASAAASAQEEVPEEVAAVDGDGAAGGS